MIWGWGLLLLGCLVISNSNSPIYCSPPGFLDLHHLLKFAQNQVLWVSDAIQPPWPLSFLLLPSIFPSIRVFSNELALHIRWPKYWSFSISPSNKYSRLISFTIDWFDFLAVQGTLKWLLQLTYYSQKHQFFGAQPSLWLISIHDYWKNNSSDYMEFYWKSKVTAFNILLRFGFAFLLRNKHLLISWLQPLQWFWSPRK